MTFKEKIDNILRISNKKFTSVYDLEQKSGVGMGTLRKAYDEDREPSKRTIWKVLESVSVNPEWWETGKGEVFLTSVPNSTDNNGKDIEPVLQELIERNEKYRLVPTIILDKYEILSNRELESREKLLQKMLNQAEEISATKQFLLDEKDKLIDALEVEINELRAKLKHIPPPQDA